MSVRSSSRKPHSRSGNRQEYFQAFVVEVHRLIALGYARVHFKEWATIEEEVITERLVKAVNEAIEAKDAKRWMKRYQANDNVPVSHPTREGKRRPRVDIEVVLHNGSPRPRFHFESKRLGPGNSVGDYLGDDGLGCFLVVDYARGMAEAGMLGYVQSDTCDVWAENVGRSVTADRRLLRVARGSNWESIQITEEIGCSFRTRHTRPAPAGSIVVYHSFLLFHPG